MMDVLTRIRELLSTKKPSQKRKSSLGAEYDDLERSKKFRMSELNGDYEVKPHLANNSGNHYSPIEIPQNRSRRSDSYVQNDYKSAGYFALDHSNEQNDINTNYNSHNGNDTRWGGEFKTPMPLKNGSSYQRIPALVSAKSQAFDGTTMFNRSRYNKPQQTITPHYNRFGEPSELSNFKSIPDLYPISKVNSASNASYLSSSSNSLTNGYDQPTLATQRYAQNTSGRSALSASNTMPSTSMVGQGRSLFMNSTLNSKNSTMASTMGSKSNLTLYNNDPPKNLSRSRYQAMLTLVPGLSFLKKSNKKNAVNSSSVKGGVVDLSEEIDLQTSTRSTPGIVRVNSLKARLETKEVYAKPDWEQSVNEKYKENSLKRRDSLRQLNEVNEECERKSRDTAESLQEKISQINISSLVYEDEEEEEPANDYPNITDKQKDVFTWISGRDTGTVLISKFNLSVTRHDIQTLQWSPLTWLNDEVINFFMELLAERSRTNEKLPKVHAMNTFFLKRLMENGYSGVRRWTRKVDIFAHDIIPIPVHKGIHWCMSIIHLKNKTIKYYDSMGAPNNPVLTALANYLKEESLDKKKCEFDMSGWTFENVRNIPQQENGSDCGVFSCMYAEFITRNRPIVFSQQHMTYFRMKMVYEICTGKMLN